MLSIAGMVIQLVGLGVAAWGLHTRWKTNAAGDRFIPARVRNVLAWRPWRTRKHMTGLPQPIQVRFSVGNPIGNAPHTLVGTSTVEEQIRRLSEDLQKVERRALDAQSAIASETQHRESALKSLRADVEQRQREADRAARDQVIGDVRLSSGGLAFAVLGLALQIVAAVAGL